MILSQLAVYYGRPWGMISRPLAETQFSMLNKIDSKFVGLGFGEEITMRSYDHMA